MYTQYEIKLAHSILKNDTPQSAHDAGEMSFVSAFLCIFGSDLHKRLEHLYTAYPTQKQQDALNWELSPRSIHEWTPYSLMAALGLLVRY